MEQGRTEKPRDQEAGMSGRKRIILISTCAGVGFATVLGAILWAYSAYRARPDEPKGWNRDAMIASFDEVQFNGRFNVMTSKWEGDKFPYPRIVFDYIIENKTDSDYWFQSATPNFVLMVRLKGSERQEETLLKVASLNTDFPNFVPAHGRAHSQIYFAEDFYSSELGKSLGEFNPFDQFFVAEPPEKFVAHRWTNLNGFVAYDSRSRYQINFPRAW
jgi:hypothetical protein